MRKEPFELAATNHKRGVQYEGENHRHHFLNLPTYEPQHILLAQERNCSYAED